MSYMAKNLEAINKVRSEAGLEPMTEIPGIKEGSDNEQGQSSGDKKGDATATSGTPEGSNGDGNATKPNAGKDPIPGEPDDTALLAALRKRGINVNSFDDLRPKPDAAQLAEQRDAKMLSFGLNNGLFTRRDYENYVKDSSDIRALVFNQYLKEAKEDDQDLTNEEIQAEFEQKYSLDHDPESRRYKRGMQEITLLAEKILKEKYQKIFTAEAEFQKHEKTEQGRLSRQENILSKAPAYKVQVDEVFAEMKKFSSEIQGGDSFEVEVTDEMLDSVKSQFLSAEFSAEQIEKGTSKEELRDLVRTSLLFQYFPYLAGQIAVKYHLKRQAGSKGIPPTGDRVKKDDTKQLSAEQQQVLQAYGIDKEAGVSS